MGLVFCSKNIKENEFTREKFYYLLREYFYWIMEERQIIVNNTLFSENFSFEVEVINKEK